jgi:hypothetical protein
MDNEIMKNSPEITQQLFDTLEGNWAGEGRGGYPTVTSFDYRENITFTRRDEKSLAYEQRTQKRYDGQSEWLVSHWENGFIRILENDELELINAQMGRGEVLTGMIDENGPAFKIHFVSKTITNDPRMVSSARRFELNGDTLHYEMEMQTTEVEQMTNHLRITLHRVKTS